MLRSRASLLLLGLLSCKEPTQIMLEITTDGRCPGDDASSIALFRSLGIAAGETIANDSNEGFSATTSECVASPTIGSLVLVPASERGGDLVEVLVVGAMERGGKETTLEDCDEARVAGDLTGTTCIVARRRLGFVDGVPLTLPIELEAVCIGVTCEENKTCFGGSCVDSAIECDEKGCTDPGTGGSGGAGPSSSGTGANGSGANGSGASGSGASGAGGSGASGGGGAGPGGAGPGSGGAAPGGAGPGSGGAGGDGGMGGFPGVGGLGGGPVVDCPPQGSPPSVTCESPMCSMYCGACTVLCASPSDPCSCIGVLEPE